MTSALEHGAEETSGRRGAVLRAVGDPHPRSLGRHGPWVATTLAQARSVLTDPVGFDFPVDVSRRGVRRRDAGPGRSPHELFTPLGRDRAEIAAQVLGEELDREVGDGGHLDLDAMRLLRRPVARATAAATLADEHAGERDEVADAVLAWVDALGPVISAARPPRSWSRARRTERRARQRLESRLSDLGDPSPARTATVLAAGTQVPIAAGAWLLVALAERPDLQARLRDGSLDASAVVWEVLRLTPPTWVTARVTRREVDLAGARLPEGAVVLVSPLLMGRLGDLVPPVGAEVEDRRGFAPERWQGTPTRPGAWLPFGAGPHACPGRSVGMSQLLAVTAWAAPRSLRLAAPVQLDQTRGIFPRPARFDVLVEDGEGG